MIADQSIHADLLAELTSRTVEPDRAPQAWPTFPPSGISSELRSVADAVLARVRGEPGFAVLRLAQSAMDDHGLVTAAWNAFTILGEPVPQYQSGELIYPVEVGDTPSSAVSHYSGTNQTGGFHTDGTLLPRPPDFAALVGLSAADVGGETVLVDGRTLCGRLDAADPGLLPELRRPHPFDVQGQTPGPQTRRQPIVSDEDGRFELRYLRRYIEQGYTTAGATLPDRLHTAMDLIDELCSTQSYQQPVLLARGTMLIWNNGRFLHGRLPFTEFRSKRRLRRMYATFAADRPAPVTESAAGARG